MSINKLISIKNPIIDALDDLGLDHAQDMPIFTRWATLAEKEIGSYFQYVLKTATLNSDNCAICLPSDARYIRKAVLGDISCDCDSYLNSTTFGNLNTGNFSTQANSFLIVDIGSGVDSDIICNVPYTVQDNKLVLGCDMKGRKISIQYLGYKTDCDGFLEVGENHVNAINWFIKWKYFYRKRNLSPMEQGKMNTARQEWQRECAHARAQDADQEGERQAMVNMLHDPLIGYGLDLGMHNTLDNYIW